MSWKRNEQGNFSKAQHRNMVRMHQKGKSPVEIAEIAGCSPVSVRRILNLTKSGEPAIARTPPETESLKEENSYLRWVVSGIINHVKGDTYIDKLVSDLGEGKFNP